MPPDRTAKIVRLAPTNLAAQATVIIAVDTEYVASHEGNDIHNGIYMFDDRT